MEQGSDPGAAPHVEDPLLEQLLERRLKLGLTEAGARVVIVPFGEGHASLVARLELDLGLVLKAGSSPIVLRQANRLRAIAEDSTLPDTLRRSVPAVYATAADPPHASAYLMEELSGFDSLEAILLDPARQGETGEILSRLWDMLGDAYARTRDPLLVPNLDYLIAALEPELRSASRLEPALAADRTIRLIRPDQHETLPPWGEVLVAARDAAATSGPAFSTFVWGDLRPRNVLVRTEESGQLALRLLDPDPRGRGDWTRDIARLGHGLRLEIPAAGGAIAAHPTLSRTSDATEIRYGFDWPSHLRAAEEFLLAEAQAFAEQQHDPSWARRYGLGLASSALGPVAGLLEAGMRDMAIVSFVAGLRALHAAATKR